MGVCEVGREYGCEYQDKYYNMVTTASFLSYGMTAK